MYIARYPRLLTAFLLVAAFLAMFLMTPSPASAHGSAMAMPCHSENHGRGSAAQFDTGALSDEQPGHQHQKSHANGGCCAMASCHAAIDTAIVVALNPPVRESHVLPDLTGIRHQTASRLDRPPRLAA